MKDLEGINLGTRKGPSLPLPLRIVSRGDLIYLFTSIHEEGGAI